MRVAGVVALAAALVVFGAFWLVERSGYVKRVTGGPLTCSGCGGGSSSIPALLDQAVSYGLIRLRNGASEPAVIESVELLDAGKGIDMVGALALSPPGLVGVVHGYPPEDAGEPIRRAEGFVVDPTRATGNEVQVVLGVRLTRHGRYVLRHVGIDYHVGRAKFRVVVDARLALCASRATKYPECKTPSF